MTTPQETMKSPPVTMALYRKDPEEVWVHTGRKRSIEGLKKK